MAEKETLTFLKFDISLCFIHTTNFEMLRMKGYGHSMMNLVYRRKGLSSLSRNSEDGPLTGWLGGWPMAEGGQSRPARCAAAAAS